MSNQTYFQDEWLEENKFSSLVAQVLDDNKKAKCKVCRKSFELSIMGRGALYIFTQRMQQGFERSL